MPVDGLDTCSIKHRLTSLLIHSKGCQKEKNCPSPSDKGLLLKNLAFCLKAVSLLLCLRTA